MFGDKDIITAVEIGTSKICVLIGKADNDERISVLGFGEIPSASSVVKGEITSIANVSDKVRDAISAAEDMADTPIDPASIFIGITGSHIQGTIGSGKVIIASEDRKITKEHISEVARNASQIAIPYDCVSLNSIHGDFLVDGTRRTANPEGQTADKLEVSSFTIYGRRNCVENFRTPLREYGYNDPYPVFSVLAAAHGALSDDEMKHGVLFIDMGAGTTEFILFRESCACSCGIIPVGCDHIANDLFIGLDLNIQSCRKIIEEQSYSTNKKQGIQHISIEGALETRKIPINSIEKIIDLRLNETFRLIQKQLKQEGQLMHINKGIVIAGGASLIVETINAAHSVFDCPVRIGSPPDIYGPIMRLNSPRYTMLTGLLSLGKKIIETKDKKNTSFILSLDRAFRTSGKKILKSLKESFNF